MEERPSDDEVLEFLGRVMGKTAAEQWAGCVRGYGDSLAVGMAKQLGAFTVSEENPITTKFINGEIEARIEPMPHLEDQTAWSLAVCTEQGA